ncbi:MAG: HipA domain-containing protein [Bacteroidales bacterium]|nr:HipA domain-containing protein [Bacteroidales bacterium]
MIKLDRCPSTLALGYEGYSPIGLKRLFNKKTVSPFIPYKPIGENREETDLFMKNKQRISLSGVQSKYSMVVEDGQLRLTKDGEQGTYILKPKLSEFSNREFSPENEHLTMQIAEQVFGIETAANGLCFFTGGEMAYITKRFDFADDGSKLRKEDFASLAGLTSENADKEYKYNRLSYEDVAELIVKYVPAWRIEMLKFFRLVVFNFLFCNGDAHLKNFSLLETFDGDFKLSPAYDLINTKLHVDDRIFALDKGLFKNDAPQFMPMGMVTGKTFMEWGKRIGLPDKTLKQEFDKFCSTYGKIDTLIGNSFLSEPLKKEYSESYTSRRDSYLKTKL